MRFQALKQTLEPLECIGSAYHRGLMQGDVCKKQIHLCFNAIFQSELLYLLKRDRWPESWARNVTLWQARSRSSLLKRKAPEIWTYLQGLSAGSGYPLEYFLLFHQLEYLLGRRQVPLMSGSILMIPARFSALEEPLMIRSFDAPYFLRAFNLFRQNSPEQGLKSIEMTLAPSAGAHSGMNEAGVVIAYNLAYSLQNAHYPFSLELEVQRALQSCESAAEVVRFFEAKQYSGGAIITVMDTQNEMYLIEISTRRVVSKAVNDHVLLATNHYQLPEMVPEDVPLDAYFSVRHGLKNLAGRRVRESSEFRFDRLNYLTGTSILFHPNDLLHYFNDHAGSVLGDDNSVCRHGDYYETACSVLFRPRGRELQVAMGAPCDYPYRSFQWF